MDEVPGAGHTIKGNLRSQFQRSKNARDFPSGPVFKTWSSQCRGPRFDPWSEN